MNILQQRLGLIAIISLKRGKQIIFTEYPVFDNFGRHTNPINTKFNNNDNESEVLNFIDRCIGDGIMYIQEQNYSEEDRSSWNGSKPINVAVSYNWVLDNPKFDLIYSNKIQKDFLTDIFVEAEFLHNIDALGEPDE